MSDYSCNTKLHNVLFGLIAVGTALPDPLSLIRSMPINTFNIKFCSAGPDWVFKPKPFSGRTVAGWQQIESFDLSNILIQSLR